MLLLAFAGCAMAAMGFTVLVLPILAGGTYGALAVIALVAVAVVGCANHRRWCARMRAERPDESICTFARSFPRREVDTWAIRAVWDAAVARHGFPVRATDRLRDDLGMDGDWDMDLDIWGLLRRCRRSPDRAEEYPWPTTSLTIGDLVRFLSAQPRLATAPAAGLPS